MSPHDITTRDDEISSCITHALVDSNWGRPSTPRPAHAEIVVRNAIRIGWEVATEVEVNQWVHASEQEAAEVPIAILAGKILPDQTVAVGEFTVIK